MTSDEETADLAARGSRIPDAQSIGALGICFLILLLDGLDTTSIALSRPRWQRMERSRFSAHAGLRRYQPRRSVGYVLCGPSAQSFGTRAIGGACVAVFGIGTLATGAAWDVASLSILRFVSAVGLGGAVPITIVAATGFVTARQKESATILDASGLSAGAVTGGFIGGPVMGAYGWEAVFVLGGVLPLLVMPIYGRLLQAAEPRGERPSNDAQSSKLIAQLFRDGLSG